MRGHRFAFALAFGLLAFSIARGALENWVAATELPPLARETGVEMRDRDGRLLRAYTVADGRWRLAPGTVDRTYLDMLIAYEDKRFFDHAGIDPLALLRAAVQAAWNGRVVSGGSTLTMQVARLLEESGTGRWSGKLRQMRVALALEDELSKEEILNLYLLLAPYGGNLEGVRAASLAWFGHEPARMTPAEAALLVALPQSPAARRPDENRAAATTARARVLARMQGEGVLDGETVTAALTEPVPERRRAFPRLAPHLTDLARAADPARRLHRLTIDRDLQRKLEHMVRRERTGLPAAVSMAIVVADHRSGEILASIGSTGYSNGGRHGFVDMTRAPRSPGSTLKPLVYALGFDRGLVHPQTLIADRPVSFGPYSPQNFDGKFRGELPVAEALRLSLNIPVVLLLNEIGPAHLMAALRRAGVRAHLPGGQAGLAVALGGVGITLTDLVQLYAGLANAGTARPLHWLADADVPAGRRIVSRAAAWQVGDILADLPPPRGAPAGWLAYKTGTSYGHRDAWSVGYDGAHVVGVWIGRPDGTPVPGVFGGELAAPVLFEVFQRLKPRPAPLPPPPPETLIVSTAGLPQPLRKFAARAAAFKPDSDAPKLIFPPDGASLPLVAGGLNVKLRDGAPPFTWLANGKPLATRSYRRETVLDGLGTGFSTLSVIDAEGRTARVTVRID